MKNKKILVIAVIFLVSIMISGVVNARTYNIEEEEISITLDDEYINVFTEYTENEDRLSEILPSEYYSNFVKTNKDQGAILDAIKLDEENNMVTEILISVQDNKQDEVRDFKDYDESEIKEYSKKFVTELETELKAQMEAILSSNAEVEVSEDELYTSANGDVYIKLHVNLAGQNSDFFYTVKNYKLIGVNIRYLDGNEDLEMAKKVVDQINIKDTTSTNYAVIGAVAVGVAIAIVIAVMTITKKNRNKENTDMN